jgi:hypothetical protein
LPASCRAAGSGNSSKLSTNPIIAAVPLMVLLLIAVTVGAYTYSQRSM